MTTPPRARSRRRIWGLLVLLAAAGLAVGGGFLLRRLGGAPAPPAVNLTGVDPAVAAAVRAAEQRVRGSPRSAEAWGLLGKVLLANEFYPEAQVCLRRAQDLDPREPRWPYLQAGIERWTNPEVGAELRRTVELCGDDPPAPRLHLAEWLLSRGRVEEAEAEFRRSLAAQPDNPWARLGLARAALERGDARAALAELDAHAGQGTPTCEVLPRACHDLRAKIDQRLGDPAAAAREAQRLRALPDDPPPPDPFGAEVEQLVVGLQGKAALADRYLKGGRSAEAVRLLRELVQEYPDAPGAWQRLARSLQARGDPDGAERAARETVRLAPDSVEAHYVLGLILLQQDRAADAARCFRRATELDPAFAPGYLSLGQCLDRQGDTPGALAALRDAVRYAPQAAPAHLALGELLGRAGQKQEAAAHLRNAVRPDPDNPKARHLLEEVAGAGAPPPP